MRNTLLFLGLTGLLFFATATVFSATEKAAEESGECCSEKCAAGDCAESTECCKDNECWKECCKTTADCAECKSCCESSGECATCCEESDCSDGKACSQQAKRCDSGDKSAGTLRTGWHSACSSRQSTDANTAVLCTPGCASSLDPVQSALLTAEQIIVRLPQAGANETTAIPASYTPEAVETTQSAVAERASQVLYKIQLVEDVRGSISEKLAAGNKATACCEEGIIKCGARVLADPSIVCVTGQPARLEIGRRTESQNGPGWEGTRVDVLGNEIDEKLRVNLCVEVCNERQCYTVQTAVLVEPGKSVVLSTTATTPDAEPSRDTTSRSPVYLVLTPELVK